MNPSVPSRTAVSRFNQRRAEEEKKDKQKRLSKKLCRMLRHAPEDYGVALDSQGWVLVSQVATGAKVKSESIIKVAKSDNKRYELKDHDRMIRCRYGHSAIDIEMVALQKKELVGKVHALYHGTPEATSEIIRREGIKPMNRQFVHWHVSSGIARKVGRRKGGRTVIVSLDIKAALNLGVQFYHGNGGVYLTGPVPPEALQIR